MIILHLVSSDRREGKMIARYRMYDRHGISSMFDGFGLFLGVEAAAWNLQQCERLD